MRLLPPTEPSQIWLPWLSFDSASKTQLQPERKGINAVTGQGEPIIVLYDSDGALGCEGQAVAIISRYCRRVTPAQASRFILGYTCGNDVSQLAWLTEDTTLWRAKGSDTFAPVGPWIETEADPQDLEVVLRLNGQERQRSFTREMTYRFTEIVSHVSQQVALRPGDLEFSGTTGTTSTVRPGDVVEVEVPNIGVLRNPVVMEPAL